MHPQRDTGAVFGALRLNGLATEAGHVPDDDANKNPGPRAGGTGADSAYEARQLRAKHNPKGTRRAIVKAARAIAKALVLGLDGNRVAGLVVIFSARLTEEQKAGVAYAALRSMRNGNEAQNVASLALFGVYRGEAVR